jgi:hypothetical protein
LITLESSWKPRNRTKTGPLPHIKKAGVSQLSHEVEVYEVSFGVYPETPAVFDVIRKKHDNIPNCHELGIFRKMTAFQARRMHFIGQARHDKVKLNSMDSNQLR